MWLLSQLNRSSGSTGLSARDAVWGCCSPQILLTRARSQLLARVKRIWGLGRRSCPLSSLINVLSSSSHPLASGRGRRVAKDDSALPLQIQPVTRGHRFAWACMGYISGRRVCAMVPARRGPILNTKSRGLARAGSERVWYDLGLNYIPSSYRG